MDGSNRTRILTFNHSYYYHRIFGFTLDRQAQELYWIELDMGRDYSYPFASIKHSSINGTNMQTIFSLPDDYYWTYYTGYFHLSVFEQIVYISSSIHFEISKLGINGENFTTIIDRSLICYGNYYHNMYMKIISERNQHPSKKYLPSF